MGIREREIDTPLENLGCRWLRWPIRRAEAPLFATFLGASNYGGGRKACIRDGELERRATVPILRAAVTTYSEPRAQRTVPLPSTIKGSGPTAPAPVRACVEWYTLHNIVFPKTSRLSQKNIKKEERTRISARCRCCIFTPLLRSFLLLRGSYFLFPYSDRRSAAEPFPSFFLCSVPQSLPSFISWPCAAQLPDFQEGGREQLTT